jgi:long-subunit fatty acid transport protein
MKNNLYSIVLVAHLVLNSLLFSSLTYAQNQFNNSAKTFWNNVQFGGGVGLGLNNGTTTISLSPSAIYNCNEFISLGLGVQYSYLKQKSDYTSNWYGGSIIGLLNPLEQIQLSAELEQLRVNVAYANPDSSAHFWNTGLFLGAGLRNKNVTFGARYNVFHQENKTIYGEAFMPFVRVFF